MRKAIAALVVAGMAFGGWWIYASYVMRDRATRLGNAVRSEILVVTRDVHGLPDEADVREAIEAHARELGAELRDLDVSLEQMERSDPDRGGQNQLDRILARLQKARTPGDVGMSPTGMQAVSLRAQPRLVSYQYAIHGEIVVSHGLWSHSERLDIEKVLQRRLVR